MLSYLLKQRLLTNLRIKPQAAALLAGGFFYSQYQN
jgi:glucosamine--fructose-6-phosphate aminotransferase (isomerizing)